MLHYAIGWLKGGSARLMAGEQLESHVQAALALPALAELFSFISLVLMIFNEENT